MKLAWFDRNWKQLEDIAETDDYYQVRLSPDDKQLASVVGQPSPIIWIYDVARDSKSRFTFDDKAHSNPVWSRDGNQLAYALSNGEYWRGNLQQSFERSWRAKTTPGPYTGRCGARYSHRLVARWPLDDLRPRHDGRGRRWGQTCGRCRSTVVRSRFPYISGPERSDRRPVLTGRTLRRLPVQRER